MEILTHKQEVFCQAYVLHRNAKQAATDAGYSPHTAQVQGSRLLKNKLVKERLNTLVQQQQECAGVTADYVLMQAVEVYERCMGAVPVLKRGEVEVDAQGNSMYTFDVKGALAALELIGKHVAVGAFKEKKEESKESKENKSNPKTRAKSQASLEDPSHAEQTQGQLPLALTESERAARIAKILAMAQARLQIEDNKLNV